MSTVFELFVFIIYAENTTLSSILSVFKSRTDEENIGTKINKELSKIYTWLINSTQIIIKCGQN